MLNAQSSAALKRVSATLLGMGQSRLELAGVELAIARQQLLWTLLWGLLTVLAFSFASLFLAMALIVGSPPGDRWWVALVCVFVYLCLGIWFFRRLNTLMASNTPLLEATAAELGKDRKAVLNELVKAVVQDDNQSSQSANCPAAGASQ